MGKLLTYFLHNLGLIIITLHSVIPHPHSGELTEKIHLELHKTSNSLIGIIRLAFHEGGDGQLDNLIILQKERISKKDIGDKYPIIALSYTPFSVINKNLPGYLFREFAPDFHRLFFVKPNGSRGSPL